MKRDEKEFDDLPEALIRELRSLDESMPVITASVDREVLKMAREQFATRRPAWRRPAWAAVAAAVVLAVVLGPLQMQRHSAPSYSPRQPDISDVLRLARESQGTPGAQAEIDALAYRVVSLGAPGASQ
jgi:negative regulator of sigma E activity